MAPSDRRRTPRIQPYVAPCRLDGVGWSLPGYLTDLSTKGARIAVEGKPPEPGTALVVEVRLDRRSGRACRITGTVQWTQPAGGPREPPVCGVTFEGTSSEGQRLLETVVEEFRRRAAQLA